jgi:AraC-like DNA-binding protein
VSKKITPHLHPKFSLDSVPDETIFNFDAFVSNTETRSHKHSWGQIQFISGGILEMQVESTRFLVPPHLAIWIPAGVEHKSYNRRPLEYCSMNIADELTSGMPQRTSLITVSAIVSVIVEDFRHRQISVAQTSEDKRLVQVLLDQMSAQCIDSPFLPTTTNKYLAPILTSIEANPSDQSNLKQWAERVHTTERSLARYCQSELGMSFTEWRLRLRYMHSLDLLRAGHSVKDVALTLGYKQASPFISMFKRYAGVTPEQYRHRYH